MQHGMQFSNRRGEEAGVETKGEIAMRIVKADEAVAAAETVTDTTDIGSVEMRKGGLIGDIDQARATETDITGRDQGPGTLTGEGIASASKDRRETAVIRLNQDDGKGHGRDRETETTTNGIERLAQGKFGEAYYGHNKGGA